MKKIRDIFFGILAFLLFFCIFSLFVLNIMTNETGYGNALTFLTDIFKTERIFSASNLGHQIGKVETDLNYQHEKVAVANPSDYNPSNEINYLDLGPNIYLFPGEYEVSQDLSTSENRESIEVCILDTFSLSQGVITQKTVKSTELSSQDYMPINYSFFTQGGGGFEFRNYYLGKGTLKAGEVRVATKKRDYILFTKKIPHAISRFWQRYL